MYHLPWVRTDNAWLVGNNDMQTFFPILVVLFIEPNARSGTTGIQKGIKDQEAGHMWTYQSATRGV